MLLLPWTEHRALPTTTTTTTATSNRLQGLPLACTAGRQQPDRGRSDRPELNQRRDLPSCVHLHRQRRRRRRCSNFSPPIWEADIWDEIGRSDLMLLESRSFPFGPQPTDEDGVAAAAAVVASSEQTSEKEGKFTRRSAAALSARRCSSEPLCWLCRWTLMQELPPSRLGEFTNTLIAASELTKWTLGRTETAALNLLSPLLLLLLLLLLLSPSGSHDKSRYRCDH